MAACGGSDFVGPDPDSGIPLALAEERSARLSNVRYDLRFTIPASAAEPITGNSRDPVRSEGHRAARRPRLRTRRGPPHFGDGRRPGGLVSRRQRSHRDRAARARRRRERGPDRLSGRRHRAQPQPRLPVLPLRAGAGAPDVPVLRPARHQGAIHAGADRPGRMGSDFERRRNRARNCRQPVDGAIRRDAADSDVPLRVRGRPIPGRDGHAQRTHVSHVPPRDRRRRRSRATGTRHSISTRRRSSGSRTTPPSRISSASSISSSCRRFSSAAWNIRGPSTTTPRRSFSTSRRPRTRCSAAPASSRTKRRTCGSAIW